MALAPVGNPRQLTPRERRFLAIYWDNGMNATKAYKALCDELGKPCADSTADTQGPAMMQRIRRSGDFRSILEARNLDDARLSYELDRLLRIKKTYVNREGDSVEYEDGQTQVRAAELLKDVLGHSTKTEIALTGDLPAIVVEVKGAE